MSPRWDDSESTEDLAVSFAPMPRRTTGVLSRTLSHASKAVASVEAQREPHAQFWDEWNIDAVNADGPLWIALGDSTSQGIGSADPHLGWIPLVLERLRSATNEPWRVINLSITGAQFSDIVEHQLPRLAPLAQDGHSPLLMTHLAGANNLMAPGTWASANNHLTQIVDALAAHSVVARVGVHHAGNSLMARRFNATIDTAALDKNFELFWPWKWPSRDGMGDDKWHPGAKGYGYMADTIFPLVQSSLAKRTS